jgi:hypothetical protein
MRRFSSAKTAETHVLSVLTSGYTAGAVPLCAELFRMRLTRDRLGVDRIVLDVGPGSRPASCPWQPAQRMRRFPRRYSRQ